VLECRVEGQTDRVTAAESLLTGIPGRKVRAPLGRVLGNTQVSTWSGTESGTETHRPSLTDKGEIGR